jgi:hypothetical protein
MWRKLRTFLRRERQFQELAEEIQTHAELKTRDYVERGLSQDGARAAARRDMGPVTASLEQSHDHWSYTALEDCVTDVRYALRILRKNPAFSLTAVLSLMLGIAGSTAIFAYIDGLLVRPLPYPGSDRLVRITEFYPKALLVYFQERCRTMDIAAASPGSELNITGRGPAFRITASSIGQSLLRARGHSGTRPNLRGR